MNFSINHQISDRPFRCSDVGLETQSAIWAILIPSDANPLSDVIQETTDCPPRTTEALGDFRWSISLKTQSHDFSLLRFQRQKQSFNLFG
jgi:hypothetical protein